MSKLKDIDCLILRFSTKAKAIKTLWYWHKNRHIDKWNKVESPEINSCNWSVDFFIINTLRVQETVYSDRIVLSVVLRNWISTSKRMNLDPYTHTILKINRRKIRKGGESEWGREEWEEEEWERMRLGLRAFWGNSYAKQGRKPWGQKPPWVFLK